jgi:UDP-glucose 4-epimerase
MNILITGIAGLIGSNFAHYICDNTDNAVIGIDDLSGGYIENIPPKALFYKLDLTTDTIEKIFAKYKPELIYHFAAYAAEGLSPFIRTYNYTNNIIPNAKIINATINNCPNSKIVFTSSMAVYGEQSTPFDETTIPHPIDPYGISKYACELDLEIAHRQHGIDYTIIRPHNVYGPKQCIWDKYRNVIGIWMYQKLNKLPITIFGDGLQKRAFSYINDILNPLLIAGISQKTNNQIINLGGLKEYSILETAEIFQSIVGKTTIEFLESRHEVKYAWPTGQKSIDLLEYKENTTLEIGVEKMWEWAQEQPKRPQFIWDKFEIEKGIYSFWKQN